MEIFTRGKVSVPVELASTIIRARTGAPHAAIEAKPPPFAENLQGL
jgi:hypothetical protein